MEPTNSSVTSTACAVLPKARTSRGAVVGVLQTVLQMIENGDRVKGCASRGPTYLGVATDHVIESFRNRLWADYKTGAGVEPALLAQFHPLEEALAA